LGEGEEPKCDPLDFPNASALLKETRERS
jgi:hypothetical protein